MYFVLQSTSEELVISIPDGQSAEYVQFYAEW